jgi:hypothetical protein
MAKIVLASIDSTYASVAKLNANFEAITAAINNTVSRDGTTPNAMAAILDAGGNRVVNVGEPTQSTDAVRLSDISGEPLLPPQTGHSGHYLRSDGTVATFQAIPASEVVNTAAGNIVATDVQAAINELDTEKAALAGSTFTGTVIFNDEVVLNFGTDSDAAIQHNDADTGELKISASTRVNFTSTNALNLPSGTTAQRPGTPSNGDLRYNSSNGQAEIYQSSAWGPVGGAAGAGGDALFYENDTNMTTDYTITSGKNAVCAGPLTIDATVTLTIPAGSRVAIV